MFIETETTPNPASLKFLPGKTVMPTGTREFPSYEAAEASPLAQAIVDTGEVVWRDPRELRGEQPVFGGDWAPVVQEGCICSCGQLCPTKNAWNAHRWRLHADAEFKPAFFQQFNQLVRVQVRDGVQRAIPDEQVLTRSARQVVDRMIVEQGLRS